MSSSGLGWLKVKPLTDAAEVAKYLAERRESSANGEDLLAMDPAAVRTVGMGQLKELKGVALLRRRHCTDGHPALQVTVKNLKLEGAFEDGRVTLKDVEMFKSQGCGVCEAAKMRRRPFSVAVAPEDKSPPRLGAVWSFDVLELRVPSFHTGARYVYVAVEKVSKLPLGNHMAGYAEGDVTSAMNDLRARVRPVHGEIFIMRMDSHPSHRSKNVKDYSHETQLRLQLSPPFVHEGVGDPENLFLHHVPSANALILAAPDLNENHFAQALMYMLHAKAHSVTSNSSPPRSPAMVYHKSEKFIPSRLQVFGSAAKALVHGEARSSKFELHAKPTIYVGPPINSDSAAHCAVIFNKSYVDVDLGCVAVHEDVVIDRTRRDHPCTQPHNQVAAAKTIDIGKPTSILDLAGTEASVEELPSVQPVVWVRSMECPTQWFAVLLWHGESRPGDPCSWVDELSAHRVMPLPIDLLLGGQEHNTSRGVVKGELLRLVAASSCLGALMAPRCKYFSAVRYNQPGPPVLFDIDHPDGIPDEDGELNPDVMVALGDVAFVAKVFRLSAGTQKVMMLEFPACQGEGCPYACKGREKHSTIAHTSILAAAINELGLEMIYTEQGACGASTRKPTSLVVTANMAHALRRTVGTLYVNPKKASELSSAVGLNDAGEYNTRATEVYTAKFSMNVCIAFVASMEALKEVGTDAPTVEPACDDLYPAGTRVDMWWYLDKKWYRGTVTDSRVCKGLVHGKSIPRREIRVRYDDDDAHLWHAVCDYSVRAVNEENEATQTVLTLLMDRVGHSPSDANSVGWLNLINPDLLGDLTVEELTARVAGIRMSEQRACTSFEQDHDESLACNSEPLTQSLMAELAKRGVPLTEEMLAKAFEKQKGAYSPTQWAAMEAERGEWLARAGLARHVPLHFNDGRRSRSLRMRDAVRLQAHTGEVFAMRQIQLDLESGEAVNPTRLLAVLDDGSVSDIDVSGAHGWHVPRNEREYNISPQRDLWRTAKELKMDDYTKVGMFELVPEADVDKSKYKIYDTLWAYKIKFKEGGLTFDKLNPRWCLKGGSMDRDLYKSFAEMMRDSSLNIMWGIAANYYEVLAKGLLDQHDAFQATSTVDADGKLKDGEHELYCRQAAGFVKKGPKGESLVCRLKCFMQGRIDATAGFDKRFGGLLDEVQLKPMLWDPKVRIYHNTDLAGSAASLDEIIAKGTEIVEKGLDSGAQEPPRGWAMLGQHVDDSQVLATGLVDFEKNRIISYIRGSIATVYACKLTGWQGCKMLGFDLRLNDEQRTITVTAQGTFQAIRNKLLTKEIVNISPRHIVTESVYEASPGNAPCVGDPERASYLERQSLTRTALGAGIWLSRAYPQIASGINAMCSDMSNPSDHRLGQLRHMMMYLGETPPVHLQSPNAHTSELVAAGTNLTSIVAVNGFLQEAGVRLGVPTFTYYDSKSTVFVASSDTAAKKSVWLTRRNKVVTEAVEHGESRPVHISEYDMVADSNTKYIKHHKWLRHMHYVLNLPGDPPDCVPGGSAAAGAK